MVFTPLRSLLNPKFEGYKLDPISQAEAVTRFPLEYKPTQATLSGKSSFSFQEVQSRITHNHIAVCSEINRAVYVDSSYRVILIDIDSETTRPFFRVLYELPVPVGSNDATISRNREYPSAAFLTPAMLFVSDGQGVMYALQVKDDGPSEPLGIFTLSGTSIEYPFRIHSVHRTSPITVDVLISSRHYDGGLELDSSPKGRKKSAQVEFDIHAVKIPLLSLGPRGGIRPMDVLWQRRGQDVPIYTAYEESIGSYLLIGGTSYHEIGHEQPSPYEPSPDETVSIPRANENIDLEMQTPSKPPLYSWSQTHDSITVAFPLPSNIPKSSITVTFSPQALTLQIDTRAPATLPIPHYSAKPLWGSISPSTSYWTWEREGEQAFGLLTLYLDKQHEGTKWSQVFASAGTLTSESSTEDVEVPETVDPSELWHIRESLEKFTMSLHEGDDASGLGLGKGVPSLAEGEIDVEVDDSVGRSAYITWVGKDGTTPPWQANFGDVAFKLLSTPIPSSNRSKVSLIVQHNLDGIAYSLDCKTSESQNIPEWIHSSTFSALAFVLASKRDTRFTYHSSQAVFAFESGNRDRGGNVYIYRIAPRNDKWAKQAILRVGEGYGGSLLGIGAVQSGQLLLCLTEGELVLIKNP